MIYDVGMRYGYKLLRKHYHDKLQVGLKWLRISNDTDVKHVFFISSHNTISGHFRLYHSHHPRPSSDLNNLPFHPVPFVLHPFGPSPRQQGVVVRCWDPRPAKPQRQRQVVVIINNKLGRDMSKEKPPKKEFMFSWFFMFRFLEGFLLFETPPGHSQGEVSCLVGINAARNAQHIPTSHHHSMSIHSIYTITLGCFLEMTKKPQWVVDAHRWPTLAATAANPPPL